MGFEGVRNGPLQLQAGIPRKAVRRGEFIQAKGLLLRGVVMVTYMVDDPDHPQSDNEPTTIYCDVLCYGGPPSARWNVLKGVLVSQDPGAMHRGRIWKPRATSLDSTGNTVDPNKASNPANFDGDHVLVGFLHDNLNEPVILRGLPHPAMDKGNETKTVGHRMKLKVADGDPDFWKHHGAFFGFQKNGDFLLDTSAAYDGKLNNDGSEPANAQDGAHGSVRVTLPQAEQVTIQLVDNAGVVKASLVLDKGKVQVEQESQLTVKVEGKDTAAKLTLGDGAVSAAIAETLQTWWGTVQTALNGFVSAVANHTNGGHPVDAPPPTLTVPDFPAAAISTKLIFPDG